VKHGPTQVRREVGHHLASDPAEGRLSRPVSAPTFVLAGGGNLGALQVGMLRALFESGIRPGMIVGTSVGAANGAFIATRSDLSGLEEIARLWIGLRRRDVLGISVAALIRGARQRRDHFFDSEALRSILQSFVGFDRLEDAPIPLAVVATGLATGESVVLDSGDAATSLLASSAVPRLLPPVEIDGRILVDGAASADIPVREAIALGARDIYVLPTAPLQVTRWLARPVLREIEGIESSTLHIVPPPVVRVPLADLSQSERLIDLGYEHARRWIDGGEASLADSAGDDSLHAHRRRPPIRNRVEAHDPRETTVSCPAMGDPAPTPGRAPRRL
jgi:NTE family protein